MDDRTRYPDAATVEAEFLSSPHATWAAFATEKGWDPQKSRIHFGKASVWVREKKERLVEKQLENLSEAVFSHRTKWHQDVLKTLKEYPETVDGIHALVRRRMFDWIESVKNGVFSAVSTEDLEALVRSAKLCVEAKHRSLLIDKWAFREAEELSNSGAETVVSRDERTVETRSGWKVTVLGVGELTSAEMSSLVERYYDRPLVPGTEANAVAPPAEATADETAEGEQGEE